MEKFVFFICLSAGRRMGGIGNLKLIRFLLLFGDRASICRIHAVSFRRNRFFEITFGENIYVVVFLIFVELPSASVRSK